MLDDDKNIVQSLSSLLEGDRYTIKEFYSIDELDDAIEQTPFDAYILDWIVDNKTVFNTIKKSDHQEISMRWLWF